MKTSNSLKVNNLDIAYSRSGKGEVVVLIHGITTSSFIWRNIIPKLSTDFDVIAVDLLGCGSSSTDLHADYSIKNQADLIFGLLKNLNIKKAHFVGHDIGGGIAQIIAVRYSDFVLDLVLINTIGYNYWPVQPITAMRTPIFRQLAMMSLDMGMLQKLIKRGLYKKENITDEFKSLVWNEMGDKKRRKSFLHLAKCLNNQDLMEITEDLRGINFPVLIIRGEGDLYLNSIISRKLHQDIPKSSLVTIKTGGHFIQEDEPDLIVKNILSFYNINSE